MAAMMKSSRLVAVKAPQQPLYRRFASASLVGPSPSAASVSFGYRQALGNVPETKVTRLANGVTVATESNSNNKAATVGLWIKAGSRNETTTTHGVAHFLEHLIFKGSSKRSAKELESLFESLGGSLNAYTTREHTAFYAKSLGSDVLRTLRKTRRLLFLIILHGSAFQSSSLGRTVLGSAASINGLTAADVAAFLKSNYTPDRLVLVGAGDVSHDALVKLAESNFGSLKNAAPAFWIRCPCLVSTHPTAHVAFAVEGAGWTSPDFWPLLLANSIVGSWATSHIAAKHSSLKLAQKVSEWHLADSFKSFNIPYSDTGLFGIYAEAQNYQHLDDLTHYIQQEWHRLAMTITDAEVFQAKNQLKTALLASLENTDAVADDIGKQLLAYGKRLTPWELDGLIESITVKDVNRVASQYVYDREIAVVGYGPVEALSDYTRIRSAMSPIYW
ncbi:Metalloenzyme, LuxS/M16 peptidase-like protein [Chytridium lagenaria]|nr:Metalloenzyme, LuxS/M16 peptidase-like protein [Chytridium lagenaria]